MLNVCIYCGHNKALALEECAVCKRSPSSHRDIIHSIIVCFSETEHYLNFLSLNEVEAIREKIQAGEPLKISTDVFKRAEEAYSAVELNSGPKAIQYFSNISLPIIFIVALIIFTMMFI